VCFSSQLTGLTFASAVGTSAVSFTALFSLFRWLDGSYARGGHFFKRMPVELQANIEQAPRPWAISRETSILIANLVRH